MSGASRRSSLSLCIIIVGGGLAGLASAYTLQTAGHRVRVLEQSDGKNRSHNGVRCTPNMSRYLKEWGFGPALDEVAIKCSAFNFRDGSGETGEVLGQWKFDENLLKALGADFLFMQHGDLCSLLYELAFKAGVRIDFEAKVAQVDPHHAAVVLEDGSRLLGDMIIGADGYSSVVRSLVLGTESLPGTVDEWLSLSLTIPTDLMRQHEEFVSLTEQTDWNFWFGNNCGFCGYLIDAKREYAINITVPATDRVVRELWEKKIPLDDLKVDLNFHPRICKLLKLGGLVTPTQIINRNPLECWVHGEAKVVLVGEAAHPSLPNGNQNAALALEDAVTLGNLFSRLCDRSQIPHMLSAYEEICQPRAAAAAIWEAGKREFSCMPVGPMQVARDAALREDMKKAQISADDKYLRSRWEEYITIYEYDANEAADDWWTKWGTFVEKSIPKADNNSSAKCLEVEVSRVLESLHI